MRQVPYCEGTTIKNLVSTATWHPGFVHPWYEASSASKCVEIVTIPSKLVIHWGLCSSGIWHCITRCLVPIIFTRGSVLVIKDWRVRECQTFQPLKMSLLPSATLNSWRVIVPSCFPIYLPSISLVRTYARTHVRVCACAHTHTHAHTHTLVTSISGF